MTRVTPVHTKSVKGLRKRRGTSGAAKNYVTRNQALKKLQCTLSDFRRLCILKGIYPREPRSRKKANRGSTAPASFYYSKDIAYLLHEPVLQKLRDHKAFAKKLSRALGRKEDGLAKNLDQAHESYRIDHIIKERYPVFADSIRDLDDALSLIILFSNLPSTSHVSPKVISNCARLTAEWQLYVIKSKSLRKVFLSIKGIYYQAQVEGQLVTWLVPYPFTQNVPPDVDFRIMLTFLELYQTLLGFVFYRLYQSINLIYPPKLDFKKDEACAGLGALILENTAQALIAEQKVPDYSQNVQPTVKSVKNLIKNLISSTFDGLEPTEEIEHQMEVDGSGKLKVGEDYSSEEEQKEGLFKPYKFFLSREVTRSMLEFVIRCEGGEVGWDPILGAGSPFSEDDPRITHQLIDRPVLPESATSLPQRAFIQPQWVVDCLNQSKLLPTDEYGPGKILPPHLSPFVDDEEVRRQGGYVPEASSQIHSARMEKTDESDEAEEEDEDQEDQEGRKDTTENPIAKPNIEESKELGIAEDQPNNQKKDRPALRQAAGEPSNADLIHAAEIEAEELGISHDRFQEDLRRETLRLKKEKKVSGDDKKKKKGIDEGEDEESSSRMAEMLLTGKQRKLYQKMHYSKQQRQEERKRLESKKKKIQKKQSAGLKG